MLATQELKVWPDHAACAGPIAVKAVVWVCVEHIHKHKLGFTYEGPIQGTAAVSASTRPVRQKV